MTRPEPILEIKSISRYFSRSSGFLNKESVLRAVEDVTLTLPAQSTLGLVGESGSGKSTLARMAVRLLEPSRGNVFLRGTPLFGAAPEHGTGVTASGRKQFIKQLPQKLQMIFQDPYSSLNPRLKIGYSIAEPLICMGIPEPERQERVILLLQRVGLSARDAGRYPHEFSGGQRQRIAIARALAPGPELLVCDEPVSSLDASVQAQVLNLLKDSQDSMRLSYLFISHDLTVVSHMSDQTAVMYMGRIVELALTNTLFASPLHPYTQLLLKASSDTRATKLERTADARSAGVGREASGCAFFPRCRRASAECLEEVPPLRDLSGHLVRCIHI